MIKTVQYGQSLMDIAIQYFGSAASLFELANANNLPMDADVQPGQSIIIPDDYPASAILVFADYMRESKKVVVSGLSPAAVEILITNDGDSLEGITV